MDLQERKEYWVDYADRLARYIQNPTLPEEEKTAVYNEMLNIFNVIKLFDVPKGRIPKKTIMSKATLEEGETIPDKYIPQPKIIGKVFKFRYDGRSKKFKRIE